MGLNEVNNWTCWPSMANKHFFCLSYQFEYLIKIDAEQKGLYHASIIDSYLVDFYVPFLPLERSHVKRCIHTEIEKYNITNKQDYEKNNLEADLNSLADEMVYEPPGLNIYSSSGCKRVPNLVRTLIAQKEYIVHNEL